MYISKIGLELIAHYEGVHDGDLSKIGLQPKMCPAGIWTVGYGHAIILNGKFLRGIENKELAYSLYPNLTEEQARALLNKDTDNFSLAIDKLCREHNLKPKQGEFDALVSLAYNCGVNAIYDYRIHKEMAVLRAIKKGSPAAIVKAFALWNKCNGKPLLGLTKRRSSEGVLYTSNKLILS